MAIEYKAKTLAELRRVAILLEDLEITHGYVISDLALTAEKAADGTGMLYALRLIAQGVGHHHDRKIAKEAIKKTEGR